MSYFFDSNVFLRLIEEGDGLRPTALTALRLLRERNEVMCYSSQVLAEIWTVCTRPSSARGGFGLSPSQTERKIHLIEKHFRFLPDSLATHHEWRRLLVHYSVSGVQVHDARLVAVMNVYGVQNLLTFNTDDFKRFTQIVVINPSDLK
jgi:predicted nucleic acid-binding protein